jgi:hypothetical protein
VSVFRPKLRAIQSCRLAAAIVLRPKCAVPSRVSPLFLPLNVRLPSATTAYREQRPECVGDGGLFLGGKLMADEHCRRALCSSAVLHDVITRDARWWRDGMTAFHSSSSNAVQTLVNRHQPAWSSRGRSSPSLVPRSPCAWRAWHQHGITTPLSAACYQVKIKFN